MGDQVLHRRDALEGSPDRFTLLNASFDRLSFPDVVDAVMRVIAEGDRGYLCTVNVAILMMMRSDPDLQRFVDRARWVVADGQPIVWAADLAEVPLPGRVTGVELMDWLCARAEYDGVGVYFLGGTPEVAEGAVATFRAKYPHLEVRGVADGYFTEAEAPARARAIADSGAELLFVGMGCPRQERFIDRFWDELGANVAIGVGGSLDVFAGVRRRAPDVVQRLGMEWAYRAAQEPRRLLPRYLATNSRFAALMSRELLGRWILRQSSRQDDE